MQRFRLLAVLAAAAMLQPVSAVAEEELILPPCQTTLYYSVGTAIVHFDRNCTGGTISIYRSQPEGEFLYYTYDPVLIDTAEMHCALIEGDYKLELSLPSDEGEGFVVCPPLLFTVQDPDMDEAQSFDFTQIELWLTNDADGTEDMVISEASVLEDRVIHETQRLILARRDFHAGDLHADGSVDPSDAAGILLDISITGSGGASELTAMQRAEADVNGDRSVDAADAADILTYIAACAADNYTGDITDFLRESRN